MVDKKKLKVLIVSTTKFELDGITNVILNYFRAMDKSDIQIDFVVPNILREDLRKELEAFGSEIYQIRDRSKRPISYLKKLSKLIYNKHYNIVHAHGNSSTLFLEMYAAKKGGAKVRIPHSHNSTSRYPIIHKIFNKPFKNTYTHAFACGEKAGRWLYGNENFEIIKNGIDVAKFKFNPEIRERYRKKYKLKNKKVVGHIGHFNYQKNHEYLIEVFNELYKIDQDYRLILMGDGKLRSDIETKVLDLGLANVVVFTGKTLEIPFLIQALDVIVMPSRYEGLPLTLIEAQAAGVTCFVSDTVSKEARITDLVNFISLEKEPCEWANIIHSRKVIDREINSVKIIKEITEAGYSIAENAKKQKELYKKFYIES